MACEPSGGNPFLRQTSAGKFSAGELEVNGREAGVIVQIG